MKRSLGVLLGLGFGLLLVTPAFALDADAVFPSFASKAVRTTDDVSVVFDVAPDPDTVSDDAVYVTVDGDTTHVPGSLSIETTNITGDTIRFAPAQPWTWGRRYRLHITTELRDGSDNPYDGALSEDGLFVANIPNDFAVPIYDPGDPLGMITGSTPLMGFNPLDPETDAEPWQIPGFNATGAWKSSLGSPDVLVAVIDAGFYTFDDVELRRAFALNAGELPLPNDGGSPCVDYDCDGDGRFDVDDYAADDRLPGPGLTPRDLLDAFSDGVDDDGNGLTDDICGWDFVRNVNDPIGDYHLPLGDHGFGRLRLIAEEGDNGHGSTVGVCPNCRVLPIRAGTSLLYDYNRVAAGVRYATSMGARVVNFSAVSFTYSQTGHRAILDAHDAGALTVAVTGDEMTYHHWMPAAAEGVFAVKSTFALPPVELGGFFNLEDFGFTESFCTNYGTHTLVAVPADTGCTSEGTGSASGMLGLLYSRAAELGIDLGADEAKQIMTMTAYDVQDHCASIANLLGVCQPGFDEHFGYGRPDLERALQALGDPERGVPTRIPPTVTIDSPRWWSVIDPAATPTLSVTGSIEARAYPVHWVVQLAQGREPLESEFVTVAQGQADAPIDGDIATVPLNGVFPRRWASGVPRNQYSYNATVRVQAAYEPGSGTVVGEARKTVSVHIDDDAKTGLMPGFPYYLGDSGESAPVLYDLDGDNRLEVVLGTGGGTVAALRVGEDGAEMMPGFPADLTGDDPWVADTIFASVAVGDLFGDGEVEIVAATTGGRVWAVDADGAVLPGFPVAADDRDNSSAWSFAFGNGFYAAPVLVDLDGDGVLEIVAAGADEKVYAWKPRADGVDRLAGWPVLARSDSGLVDADKVCVQDDRPYPILGTPAAGILDPSSDDPDVRDYPSVIVETNEACEGGTSRAYAIYHNGEANPRGPFLPGWPATPTNPFGALIPIAWITGAIASPVVYMGDDGARVGVATIGWFPQVVRYTDARTTLDTMPVIFAIDAVASPSFSALEIGGPIQYLLPMTGAVRIDELGFQLMNSKLFALDLDEPHDITLEGEVEDIPMLASAAAADLDNDGEREAIVGTGGSLIHAFSPGGGEAADWPKLTGQWAMATPALGDVDADGALEAVAITREGWLYTWNTRGAACVGDGANADWRRFHGDERNTGFYGADTLPPSRVDDLSARRTADGGVRVHFTAPGDDWGCGRAAAYDLRYVTDAADLSDASVFSAATSATGAPSPALGGRREAFVVNAPGAVTIALRAVDESGHLSRISEIATVEPYNGDDDADDDLSDDDTLDDDTGDDAADDDIEPLTPSDNELDGAGNPACGC